jgi:hypothetical protein
MNPREAYVKCCKCGKILDPDTEALEHDSKDYCLEHFEEAVQEEQDKDYQ